MRRYLLFPSLLPLLFLFSCGFKENVSGLSPPPEAILEDPPVPDEPEDPAPQPDVPEDPEQDEAEIFMLTGGHYHSMALNNGTLWAWGYSAAGRLGDGLDIATTVPYTVFTPTRVVGNDSEFLTDIISVSASFEHSLALKRDGTVWSWGRNHFGVLGTGDTQNKSIPQRVLGIENVIAISAGSRQSVFLKNDGTVWISEEFGSIANLGSLNDVKAIAAGDRHSLALKNDGTVWAWGYNNYGQLGKGTVGNPEGPVQVWGGIGQDYLTDVTSIASSGRFSVALKSDGTVWTWGFNNRGQLGDNNVTNENIRPIQVLCDDGSGPAPLSGISSISTGRFHTLAVKNDGTLWSWGSNFWGQIGNDTIRNKYDIDNFLAEPTKARLAVQVQGQDGVGFLENVMFAQAGFHHSFAVTEDKTIWSWGQNRFAKLGRDPAIELWPTPVHFDSSIILPPD